MAKRWTEAKEWLRRSVDYNRKLDNTGPILANTYGHLCEVMSQTGELKEAIEWGELSMVVSRRNGLIKREGDTIVTLIFVYSKLGEIEKKQILSERLKKLNAGVEEDAP